MNSLKLTAVMSLSLFLAMSCARERPIEQLSQNTLSGLKNKNDFNGLFFSKATVISTSTNGGPLFVGLQSDMRMGHFKITGTQLRFLDDVNTYQMGTPPDLTKGASGKVSGDQTATRPATENHVDLTRLTAEQGARQGCRDDEVFARVAVDIPHRHAGAELLVVCDVVDPALAVDPRFASEVSRKQHEDELDHALAEWTSSRDRWEVTRVLQAVEVAAFPCMTTRDLVEDEHLQARGLFEALDHSQVGRRVHAGIPWRLANGPNGVRAPAPLLGADTDSVLGELLGYAPERIQQLREDKIVY